MGEEAGSRKCLYIFGGGRVVTRGHEGEALALCVSGGGGCTGAVNK